VVLSTTMKLHTYRLHADYYRSFLKDEPVSEAAEVDEEPYVCPYGSSSSRDNVESRAHLKHGPGVRDPKLSAEVGVTIDRTHCDQRFPVTCQFLSQMGSFWR
jgi:hypothetical protein